MASWCNFVVCFKDFQRYISFINAFFWIYKIYNSGMRDQQSVTNSESIQLFPSSDGTALGYRIIVSLGGWGIWWNDVEEVCMLFGILFFEIDKLTFNRRCMVQNKCRNNIDGSVMEMCLFSKTLMGFRFCRSLLHNSAEQFPGPCFQTKATMVIYICFSQRNSVQKYL